MPPICYICQLLSVLISDNSVSLYVTGSKFGIQNWWYGQCVAVGNTKIGQQGCWQMCRQASAALLCMCSAFPAKKGKQMIVMSFSDITSIMLMHRGRGYIRKACMSLKAIIWVFGAEHSGNLLGSHRPFVMVPAVPLMEWKCLHTGKCPLFVPLHVPKIILSTLS